MENESTLSDALLRQLMAVGQVDILVGLPTLNNAATILDVVRAIHVCFTRDFPRLRTVMINSDGGSTDGTPELIRDARRSPRRTWSRRRTRCERTIASSRRITACRASTRRCAPSLPRES